MVTTPNLDLNLPTVGANRDTWGALLNDNFTTLDQSVSMAMPIGAILDFAGPTAPPGWLICDGRLVSRVTYATLFSVISTYWGAGDGSTTFALPPCMGRANVGPGRVIDDLGHAGDFGFTGKAGYIWNLITQAYLPNYAMATDVQGWHYHIDPGGINQTALSGAHGHATDLQGDHDHGGTTQGTSNDHTHSGSTDAQGSHQHNISLPASATAAAFGAVTVMTTAAGNANYQTDIQGLHSHGFVTGGQNFDHTHRINVQGAHTHTALGVAGHTHGIWGDGNHAHNVWMGGGGQFFETLSPILVVTKIIYAGLQASTRVLTAAAAPMRRLSAPLRGSH